VAFDDWRADGFPASESPTNDPVYVANLRAGPTLRVVSCSRAISRTRSQDKADVFAQAALIDALALFLLGVAGINRLRAAASQPRSGWGVYIASLVLMATAY
jgi:hypothetical protein